MYLFQDFFAVKIAVQGKNIQLENNAQSNSIRLAILQSSRCPPVLVYYFRFRNNCNLLQQRRSEIDFKQYLIRRRRNDLILSLILRRKIEITVSLKLLCFDFELKLTEFSKYFVIWQRYTHSGNFLFVNY